MYNPLVSIIIPVYNGSNFLRESISSALAQTYKNIEIIIVNDGSNDDGKTEKIALSYGDKVRYFYKENGGVASALNLGISQMKGEWFSWLSHDDLYAPEKIESGIKCINNNGLDKNNTIISCKTGLIDSERKPIFRPKRFYAGFYNGKHMFENLCKGRSLEGCSLLIPKMSLEKIGGFKEGYRFIQDWICWLELAMANNNFYLYEEELVKSRVHGNQDTIKLASLQPIEVNRYLSYFLSEFGNDINEEGYFIKTILLYYITRKTNRTIRRSYIELLKAHNKFNNIDTSRYLWFSLIGKVDRIFRITYKKLLNAKYRSIK